MLDQSGLYTTPIVYYVCRMHMQGMCEIISSKIAICENLTLENLALYGMQLPVTNCSYHGNILAELSFVFFCAGLERVDGTTVLGKLDRTWRSIGGKQLSISFTSLEVQLVTANACRCNMYISWLQ